MGTVVHTSTNAQTNNRKRDRNRLAGHDSTKKTITTTAFSQIWIHTFSSHMFSLFVCDTWFGPCVTHVFNTHVFKTCVKHIFENMCYENVCYPKTCKLKTYVLDTKTYVTKTYVFENICYSENVCYPKTCVLKTYVIPIENVCDENMCIRKHMLQRKRVLPENMCIENTFSKNV